MSSHIPQSPELYYDWSILGHVPASEAILGARECSELFGLRPVYVPSPEPLSVVRGMPWLAWFRLTGTSWSQSSSSFKVFSQ